MKLSTFDEFDEDEVLYEGKGSIEITLSTGDEYSIIESGGKLILYAKTVGVAGRPPRLVLTPITHHAIRIKMEAL